MSSSDDAAGGRSRRRALGRGPGTAPGVEPTEEPSGGEPHTADEAAAPGPDAPDAPSAQLRPAAVESDEERGASPWPADTCPRREGPSADGGRPTEPGHARGDGAPPGPDPVADAAHADDRGTAEPPVHDAVPGNAPAPASGSPEPSESDGPSASADEPKAPAAGTGSAGAPGSGGDSVGAPAPGAGSDGAPDSEAEAAEAPAFEAGAVEPPASGADSDLPGTDEIGPPAPEATPDEPPDPDAAPQEPQDDGRFKVVLDNFEGPFDLLLQLISKHKLDVTEVALSRVTDEFMAHIHAMGPEWDLDQATEFLVVAATLLDLKAARLLPTAEVEDEADLALLEARDLLFARLLQYRAYKEIAVIFAERLAAEARRYPRTVGLEPHHAELLPEVVLSIGPEGFARLAVKAMQPKPKPEVYVEHIHAPLVSVREQAQVVVGRLRELGEASFRTLVDDADDTLTVVARFLALLELYRERAVGLEQSEALGELTVSWTGGEGTDLRVTDEFDRAPEQPEEQPA